MQSILITSKSSLSALGHESDEVWKNYQRESTCLSICCFNDMDTPTGRLQEKTQLLIDNLRKEDPHYRRLDKSVLMAILVGRDALSKSKWSDLSRVGINMGSSRGATQLFEKYHEHFINSPKKRISPLVSPTTTLGNISSWMAFDFASNGATLTHSITCSTALHSILNACV
ncbi:MAG: beta-ketoacyl synthase, partial [Flavobacteriales bacterium]|nr:beta-ketoacyl synthase [Flavobacteriales bacterium]